MPLAKKQSDLFGRSLRFRKIKRMTFEKTMVTFALKKLIQTLQICSGQFTLKVWKCEQVSRAEDKRKYIALEIAYTLLSVFPNWYDFQIFYTTVT